MNLKNKICFALMIIVIMSYVGFSEVNGTLNKTNVNPVIGLYGYIKSPNNKYPCSTNSDCYSGYCRSDYAGGKYCAGSSTTCVHKLSGDTIASNYENGEYAPDCKDDTHRWKCNEGTWESVSCPSGYKCSNGNCKKEETNDTSSNDNTNKNKYCTEAWVCKDKDHVAWRNYTCGYTKITFCEYGCSNGKCNVVHHYNITFVNLSSLWKCTEGNEKTFLVHIKNNGDVDASVKLNISGCNCTVEPKLIQIPIGKTKSFSLIINESKYGTKEITIYAYANSTKIEKKITLTVLPNNKSIDELNKTLENIEKQIDELKNEIYQKKKKGYDTSFAEINLKGLEENLNETKKLIEQGDYITASNLLSDMKANIEKEQNIINSSKKKKSGSLILIIIVIVITSIAVVGLYIFWPRDHGYKAGVGYVPRGEENPITKSIRNLIDKYKRWRLIKKLEKEEKKFKYKYKA